MTGYESASGEVGLKAFVARADELAGGVRRAVQADGVPAGAGDEGRDLPRLTPGRGTFPSLPERARLADVTSATVVGASVAGLLTARVLCDLVDEVRCSSASVSRTHLAPVATCRRDVTCTSCSPPGSTCSRGGSPGSARSSRHRARSRSTARAPGCSRRGATARRATGAGPYSASPDRCSSRSYGGGSGVGERALENGVVVDRVDLTEGRVDGTSSRGTAPADLVVDCSGRSSRLAHQLELSGLLAPPVSRVQIDCAYASGFLPRSADDLEGSFLVWPPRRPSFRVGCGASGRGRAVDGDAGGRARRPARHVGGRGPGVRPQPPVASGGAAHRASQAAVVGGVVPLPVEPASALREAAELLRGTSPWATPRAASTRSTARAWPVRPSRPRRSVTTVESWGSAPTSCRDGSTARGDDHRRALGDRRGRRLPAPRHHGPEGTCHRPGQPLHPAAHPGDAHLRRSSRGRSTGWSTSSSRPPH